MKGIIKDLDRGFYEQARAENRNPLALMTDLIAPEPDQLAAVKGQVLHRWGLTPEVLKSGGQTLEQNVDDLTYLFAGLALEMQARGIRGDMTVENAFFSSAHGPNQPLFPVYLASQIIAGQMAGSLVPYLCASVIPINSMVQEKVTSTDTESTRELGVVAEGAALPKTTISRSNGSIQLVKYGRELDFTYESVRLLHLDIIGLLFQRMGRQLGISESNDVIETLLAGDGNSGTAVTYTTAEVANTLDYDELVRLFQAFPIGYQMRQAVTNDTLQRTILNMSEFKDPMAGFKFSSQGVLPGPMGANWHRWTSTGSSSFGTDRILAVDDRAAAVCYTMGDMLEEADQLIDRQIHRRTMSYFRGIMKWENDATQALKLA